MTAKQKEQAVNQMYSDMSLDSMLENFIYLTNKSRGKHTTESNLTKQHQNNKLGTLLKKLDSIAYNCISDPIGYNYHQALKN